MTSDAHAVVRTGVIGLGYWGPNLARNLSEHGRSELTWLCDLDAEATLKMGARYPTARTTTDVSQMLADPELDAVAIVTPVSTHHALAAAALAAGKHVFIEKPLAASSAEALDLMRRADQAGLVLFPGHTISRSCATGSANCRPSFRRSREVASFRISPTSPSST